MALGDPITTSFNGGSRNLVEDNGWPNVDMCVALGLGSIRENHGAKERPFEVGFSGVVGEIRRTGLPTTIYDVRAVGSDVRVNLSDRAGVTGAPSHRLELHQSRQRKKVRTKQ